MIDAGSFSTRSRIRVAGSPSSKTRVNFSRGSPLTIASNSLSMRRRSRWCQLRSFESSASTPDSGVTWSSSIGAPVDRASCAAWGSVASEPSAPSSGTTIRFTLATGSSRARTTSSGREQPRRIFCATLPKTHCESPPWPCDVNATRSAFSSSAARTTATAGSPRTISPSDRIFFFERRAEISLRYAWAAASGPPPPAGRTWMRRATPLPDFSSASTAGRTFSAFFEPSRATRIVAYMVSSLYQARDRRTNIARGGGPSRKGCGEGINKYNTPHARDPRERQDADPRSRRRRLRQGTGRDGRRHRGRARPGLAHAAPRRARRPRGAGLHRLGDQRAQEAGAPAAQEGQVLRTAPEDPADGRGEREAGDRRRPPPPRPPAGRRLHRTPRQEAQGLRALPGRLAPHDLGVGEGQRLGEIPHACSRRGAHPRRPPFAGVRHLSPRSHAQAPGRQHHADPRRLDARLRPLRRLPRTRPRALPYLQGHLLHEVPGAHRRPLPQRLRGPLRPDRRRDAAEDRGGREGAAQGIQAGSLYAERLLRPGAEGAGRGRHLRRLGAHRGTGVGGSARANQVSDPRPREPHHEARALRRARPEPLPQCRRGSRP